MLIFLRPDCFDEDTRLKRCAEELRNKLQELNDAASNEIQNHLNAAVENSVAGIRYFRVQADGPRQKEISERNPLLPRYSISFTIDLLYRFLPPRSNDYTFSFSDTSRITEVLDRLWKEKTSCIRSLAAT